MMPRCPSPPGRQPRPAPVVRFSVLLPWAVAACLALAGVWTGRLYFVARTEASLMDDERKLAELSLRSAAVQREAERIVDQRRMADLDARLADAQQRIYDTVAKLAEFRQRNGMAQLKIVTLRSAPGGPSPSLALAVWDPSMQRGMLEVAKLPPLPPGKDYQLWIVDPAYPKPVSSGVFDVDPTSCQACVTFRAERPVRTPVAFAVSLERKGGSPFRQGPIILLGD